MATLKRTKNTKKESPEAKPQEDQAQVKEQEPQEQEQAQEQAQEQEQEGIEAQAKAFLDIAKDKSSTFLQVNERDRLYLPSYRPVKNTSDVKNLFAAIEALGGLEGLSTMAFVTAFCVANGKDKEYVQSAFTSGTQTKEDKCRAVYRTVSGSLDSFNLEKAQELAQAKEAMDQAQEAMDNATKALKGLQGEVLQATGLQEFPSWMVLYQKENGQFYITQEDLESGIKDKTRNKRKYNWLGLKYWKGTGKVQAKDDNEGFTYTWAIGKATEGYIVILEHGEDIVLEYRAKLTKAFNLAKKALMESVWNQEGLKTPSTNVKGTVLALPWKNSLGESGNDAQEHVKALKDNEAKAKAYIQGILKEFKMKDELKQLT